MSKISLYSWQAHHFARPHPLALASYTASGPGRSETVLKMDKNLSTKIKILSFFLIIMIVYIHSSNLYLTIVDIPSTTDKVYTNFINLFIQLFISEGIARSAVPLFFIFSGYLFFININKYDSFHDLFFYKIRHRLKTIVVPYIVWSLFGLFILFIFQNMHFIKNYLTNNDVMPLLKEMSFHKILYRISFRPIPFQLWFLRDLIFMNLLSPLIYYQIKNYLSLSYIILPLLALIWLLDIQLYLVSNVAFLFFYIGSVISLIYISNIQINKPALYILTLIWIILLTVTTLLIIYYKSDNLFILQRAAVFIGVIVIWFLYDRIPIDRLMKYQNLSAYTFVIFVAHEPALSICKSLSINLILKNFNHYNSYSFLIIYLILPIFIIYMTVSFGYYLKNNLPQFYILMTGNR